MTTGEINTIYYPEMLTTHYPTSAFIADRMFVVEYYKFDSNLLTINTTENWPPEVVVYLPEELISWVTEDVRYLKGFKQYLKRRTREYSSKKV